jgi:hypothetical protein
MFGLILVFIPLIMFAIFNLFYHYKRPNKVLGKSKSYIPLEELANDFRDFVKAINGHITKEDEEFIKRLEGHKSGSKILSATKREAISSQQFSYFVDDYNLEIRDFNTSFKILEKWGKRYMFGVIEQQAIMKAYIGIDEERAKSRKILREYFDTYHNNL